MSTFKKMEFMQTPMRSQDQNDTSNDYQSQQKQKYESNRHNLSIISNNQGPNINLDSTAHTDGQDLYDGQIPVQIKSFEREEWQTFLNFKIQLPQKGQSGGLYLELTDESNPQFLYILNLGEQQFISLKNEQNLLIDFHTFPKQITELIDLTLSTSNKEDKLHVLEIKNSGEANLNILEFNKFKSLIHLSLNFRKATDEFLKKFLSQKLNKEKNENQELRIKTQRQEELIHDKNNQMQQLSNQLQKFQEEKERILEQLALEEQKKISELREGILKREEGLKKETQFQTNQITEKYETQITNLQEKVNQLSLKNSDLSEAKMTLEVNERDMKNKIKIQERELQLLNKEVENLRIDNKEQEQIRFRQEKKITELTVQISSLEQQLKDKISQIQDNKELVNNSKSQKEIMQQSIDSYKKQVDKLEKKIELCSEQINKGNDIIEKLQSEIQKSKQKIKMKNQLALEQEKSINNYQEQIDKLQKENNEVIRNKDTTSLTNQKLESENKDLKQKIEESMRMIEQNKSSNLIQKNSQLQKNVGINQMIFLLVIQYLNQQLNEKSGPKSSFGMTNNNLSTISSKYGGMLENQYRLSNYQTESNFQNQNKLSSGTNYLGSTNNMNCSANTGKQNHLKEFDMNAQQQHYNNHSPYSNKSTFENIDYSSGGDLSKYLSQGGKNIYNQIKGETSYSTANNSVLNNNNINNSNNCQYNDEEDEDFNQRVAPIKFQKPIK
ncbi:hypothetical protein PPERSA_00924 [Pseudocohnilembus persalinus]|uniref:Spindle assembly abnormal protein 6 N-terminal domain-containing protein n=1 Tax=Pseudocohnilembus persalinus TaxID=266149 RepID=A0A0V0QEQ2_PSEPJ|nr:hypothetical protein PPERSA_00924 [Pseudocohnilembus persalinus]|eukprot:KRX00697.1 hypothetical protein PPERSA_00924 [Pseudocohnilembus persalinus]